MKRAQMTSLFDCRRSMDKLHPNFVALRGSQQHDQARALMDQLYRRMGDPNGNFRKDFQGHGFHACLFELALFAYLDSAGFDVDHTKEQPDFLASRDGVTVCIEATTANPPDGVDRDVSIRHVAPFASEDEARHKVYRDFPARTISSLSKKVRHRYHELPHCQGRPFVVAVAPYFEPGSVTYTDEALVHCLYGCGETHGPPLTGTPFFLQPDNRFISAVLFTNQLTVPRFYRLGTTFPQMGVAKVVRQGVCYEDRNEATYRIRNYRYCMGDQSAPIETWHQGVTVFANPEATVPLPAGILPCTSSFAVRGDTLRRTILGFHTAYSFMLSYVS